MAAIDRSHVHRPYPELIEPSHGRAPFEIRDARRAPLSTRGMVDLVRRVMWVPLENGSRAVSRHETGHVAFSPPRPARVGFDYRVLMAVEDARVNLALAGLGLPVELDAESHAHVVLLLAQDAKRGDGLALFVRSIASLGTSVEAALEFQLEGLPSPFSELVLDWMVRVRLALEQARLSVGGRVAPYRVGVELARRLAHELGALGILDPKGRFPSRAPGGSCVARGGGGLLDPDAREARPEGDDGDAHRALPAGRLHVKHARLTVPLRPGRGGRGWRAAREGSLVRYLARWPVDRAVFRRCARRSGGTLLVDTSGSMALEVRDLDRLLLATPHGMRVALYSGHGDAGELRIVADGGRRAAASQLASYGRGNIVDLPALEWLAKQPHPRIWVSDGAVTGIGDRGSESLKRRCAALCRRARIRRVGKLAEAEALLRGE